MEYLREKNIRQFIHKVRSSARPRVCSVLPPGLTPSLCALVCAPCSTQPRGELPVS